MEALADAIALVHIAYIAFVVIGFALILLGAALGWRWVRNFYFRAAHLLAIAIVLAEAIVGIACPLTVLENLLRLRAGEPAYARDFVGYWVDRLIFHNWPPPVFSAIYAIFTIAVLAAFFLAPPRLPRAHAKP